VLAGFHDGRGDEGVGAGPASLLGLKIANEHGWVAPSSNGSHRSGGSDATDGSGSTSDGKGSK
jgi:NADH-quinone oxidoreductase subunit E